jgi:hypothetical protein
MPRPAGPARKRSERPIGAGVLAIAILLVSTAAYSSEPDPLFAGATACASEPDALVATTAATACSSEPDGLVSAVAVPSKEPGAAPMDPQPRSLFLAAESRISREAPSPLSVNVFAQLEETSPSARRRVRLESPGRAWPFALAATADAATTYWALAHGASERNPLLALGRVDVGMVKIIQFPLLAKAIDVVEARHPRLGRRLRWATLVFHAVLAVNNVRMGHSAGELGLGAHPHVRP